MGILALHSKKVRKDLVGIAYYGMYSLQHRGQEGAGYTICDSITNGEVRIKTVKNVGLVSDVFLVEDFQRYTGNILISDFIAKNIPIGYGPKYSAFSFNFFVLLTISTLGNFSFVNFIYG